MTITRWLVALYPRPFRERWGAALENEAGTTGWRSSPNLALTLAGMWLHPMIWPATSPAQRRVRAASLAFAVSAIGWLTGHAVLEMTAAVPRSLPHSWILTVCNGLTILGLALVMPLPRLQYAVVRRVASGLVGPALVGAMVVALANDPGMETASPPLRIAVVMAWWLTLAAAAIQAVRAVASFGSTGAPAPWRLRLGLWFATLGLAFNGAIIFASALTVGRDKVLGMLAAAALLGLAIAATRTVRDLAELA